MAKARPAMRITLDNGRTLRVGGGADPLSEGNAGGAGRRPGGRRAGVRLRLSGGVCVPDRRRPGGDVERRGRGQRNRACGRGRPLQLSRSPDRALRLQLRRARQGRGLDSRGRAAKPGISETRLSWRARRLPARWSVSADGWSVRVTSIVAAAWRCGKSSVDVGELDAVAFAAGRAAAAPDRRAPPSGRVRRSPRRARCPPGRRRSIAAAAAGR